MGKIYQDESNLTPLINSIRDADMILDETCEIFEPNLAFSVVETNPEVAELKELQPSLRTDLGLKVKKNDKKNKATTKKNQKTDKAKKLVPSEVQSKRREKKLERNKKSAQKSRLRKKEEEAKKEIELEEMALKNIKLTKKIETLKSLKVRLEIIDIFQTYDRIGTTESDSGRMQSDDKVLEVEDDDDSFQMPLPDLIFQENDEYIEAASSIEDSYFSIRSILKLLNF